MTTAAPFVSASLYVGDLSNDVTEALLFEIFNAVGPVASVRVCRDTATRRSLGYAYVNFHRVDDAERALDTMNFKNIRNRPCRIMWSHRDPSLRRSGVGNIFVKNLDNKIDNKSLYDTFSMFGNILSCKVATNSKRESLGYAFVHYESEEAAQSAIERVDGKVISGKKVSVKKFKSKSERSEGGQLTFTNLYVKNLPDDFKKEELDKLFAEHGTITSSHLKVDDDGKSKGFGFVGYEKHEQAAAAVEALNGKDMGNDKILYVGRAQKKEERQKEMLEKFEAMKQDRQAKYAGVNLFVKNLAEEADDDKLRTTFSKYGTITSAKIMRDGAGKSKCFGFVCFSTPEEATKAVTELNGQMMEGKPLYVAIAQRKEHRRAHLEAQHSARRNGMQQNQMGYPHNGVAAPQMFYQQGMPQRNYMAYPPQMMRGGPAGFMRGPGGPPMMAGPPRSYQLMQVQPGQRMPQQPMQGEHPRQRRNNRNQGPMGGPRNQQPQMRPRPQQPDQPPATGGQEPLTIKALAAAPEEQRKQMIGERLFPLIQQRQPDLAGKITGMLLEMDNTELLHLLENSQALDDKCKEAIQVLEHAEQSGAAQ